jgi:hypothetical protein
VKPQRHCFEHAFWERDPILDLQTMSPRIDPDLKRMLDRFGKSGCGAE